MAAAPQTDSPSTPPTTSLTSLVPIWLMMRSILGWMVKEAGDCEDPSAGQWCRRGGGGVSAAHGQQWMIIHLLCAHVRARGRVDAPKRAVSRPWGMMQHQPQAGIGSGAPSVWLCGWLCGLYGCVASRLCASPCLHERMQARLPPPPSRSLEEPPPRSTRVVQEAELCVGTDERGRTQARGSPRCCSSRAGGNQQSARSFPFP